MEQPTRPRDRLLDAIAQIVNEADIAFPLSLVVGGAVVSGDCVSPTAYFQQLTDLAGKGTPTGDLLDDLAKEAQKSTPEFLHMRNVHLLNGSEARFEGVVRIRLDAVDAWTPGSKRS